MASNEEKYVYLVAIDVALTVLDILAISVERKQKSCNYRRSHSRLNRLEVRHYTRQRKSIKRGHLLGQIHGDRNRSLERKKEIEREAFRPGHLLSFLHWS